MLCEVAYCEQLWAKLPRFFSPGLAPRFPPPPGPVASVLWLPYQAYTLLLRPARPSAPGDPAAAAAPSNSPLGDGALLLLLVLLFHAPPQVGLAPASCSSCPSGGPRLGPRLGTCCTSRCCVVVGAGGLQADVIPLFERVLPAGFPLRQPLPPVSG